MSIAGVEFAAPAVFVATQSKLPASVVCTLAMLKLAPVAPEIGAPFLRH
jgi:hypothetical protein